MMRAMIRRPANPAALVALAAAIASMTGGPALLAEPFPLWPGLAPGETRREAGTALPARPEEQPTVTRVEGITAPALAAFPAPPESANGVGVLILPGGGFGKVVPDKEGSEAAAWLNGLGISAFVLSYRTTTGVDAAAEAAAKAEPWKRPLQDSQRAIRHLRHHAESLGLDPAKIGLLGFSAGGQVAAIHLTSVAPAYAPIDAVDEGSFRPDFSLLIYPWQVADEASGRLIPQIAPSAEMPPGFLVHTDDDRSSSLGAALIYLGMKAHGVSGELHVYQNGGHGYGIRAQPGSAIGTWTDRAADWLRLRGLAAD
jgi:acetyl esterase/lipase